MLTGKKQTERQKARVKELNGSKWNMQGTGMAEVQMVRRNLSKFLASRGSHWTETGSGDSPRQKWTPSWQGDTCQANLAHFKCEGDTHFLPLKSIKFHQMISISRIKNFHPSLVLYNICLFSRMRELDLSLSCTRIWLAGQVGISLICKFAVTLCA